MTDTLTNIKLRLLSLEIEILKLKYEDEFEYLNKKITYLENKKI